MNRIKDYKKLSEDIVQWIRQYAQDNNIKSLVVGVSGGIDSAVVSTLCALTGLPTTVLVINIHSKEDHIAIANTHCASLEDKYENIHWKYSIMSRVIDNISFPGNNSELAYANTKSRLRMIELYNHATTTNGIVVGTGNKVEDFGVGFFTKYGDGGVDISPIADLYKTEVRELGRYLGISQEILDAAPTDGLFEDGRTDEDQIGATYEELEWIMERYTDPIMGEYEEFTPRQIEVSKIYRNLHKQNRHKMLPIPIYKLNG